MKDVLPEPDEQFFCVKKALTDTIFKEHILETSPRATSSISSVTVTNY